MINFNDELHKYTTDSGREYTSVTTYIGEFKDKFDTEKVAKECEIRGRERTDYKYSGMTSDQIIDRWDDICKEALRKGNKYHDLKELEVLYSGQFLRKPLLNGKRMLYLGYQDQVDLSELEEGITYPELRIYCDELQIAGHIDWIKVDFGKVLHIKDYKTNKRPLSKKGYKGKMMKAPLDFLPDCSHTHYALQLNTYAWILEKYWGYKIGSLEVLHKRFLDDEPIPEEFRIPFVSEDKQREVTKYSFKYRPDIIELMFTKQGKIDA
jgi:hypothetical protein